MNQMWCESVFKEDKEKRRGSWMEVLTQQKKKPKKQNKHECEIMCETNREEGRKRRRWKNKDRGTDGGKWHFLQWRRVRLTHLHPAWFHFPIRHRYTQRKHTVKQTPCQTVLLLKGCERRENGVNGSKMVLTLLPTQVRLRPSPSLLSLLQLQYKARQSGAAPSKGGNKKRVWYRHSDYLEIIWRSRAACSPAVPQMFKERLQLRRILAKSRQIVRKPPHSFGDARCTTFPSST